jgi:HAMP domain-containing protein
VSAGRRRWLIAGGVLMAAAAVATVIDDESAVAGTLVLFALLWIVASLWLLLRRVWRWMTYRVAVRLLISYLLVGVTPFVFAAAFAAVGLWILMGQYTSVRFGSEIRRVRSQLAWEGAAVLERARTAGPEAAASLLEELAARNPQPLDDVIWQARIGGLDVRLGGEADLPELDWVEGDQRDIVARYGNRMFGVVAATSTAGDRVTALIPFDGKTALAISEAWWFDVALLAENDGRYAGADEAGLDTEDEDSASAEPGGDIKLSVEGRTFTGNELWPPWAEADDRLLSKPSVIWFRVTPDIVDLATGSKIERASLLALLRTSPRAVWDDFTLSRYELGSNILTPLAVLGLFFVIVYGVAAAIATMMILSITRSVRRLSVGAREVERGNLGHRVPVKRRDQLGDLARSFNHMTGSVQSMVADVAEKERLARELELAREIQESLLPASRLVLGPMVLRATFQPAAEVGGDYFDVFSIAGDRLVVAIGDVAGHGLSTGLLMAGLKSSVAALVHEGYSGADLIDRVNRLLMDSGRARTLVTLMVVEIDPAAGSLRLANAGHPPPFLIDSRSGPRELMMGSVPMGSPLCRAVELEKDFDEGSRLLLYSDGLVEALSPDGEPFGYDRLARVLAGSTQLDGDSLGSAVLGAVGEHTGGTPHPDDLTLLVVERVP